MSLLLMGSRGILTLQYLGSLYFLYGYPSARTPLTILSATTGLATIFYLGISFAFNDFDGEGGYTYVAWYIVAVVETAINIATSSYWRTLSFKGSHVVERMSLLTLIILGEGIIGLCERIQYVGSAQGYSYGMSSDFVGTIIAGLLLVVS